MKLEIMGREMLSPTEPDNKYVKTSFAGNRGTNL